MATYIFRGGDKKKKFHGWLTSFYFYAANLPVSVLFGCFWKTSISKMPDYQKLIPNGFPITKNANGFGKNKLIEKKCREQNIHPAV